MSVPPLLVLMTLLLWGWRNESFWIAVLPALALEVPRFTSRRWQMTGETLAQAWKITLFLLLGAVLFSFIAFGRSYALVRVVLWLPLLLLPAILVQTWSDKDFYLNTFSPRLQKSRMVFKSTHVLTTYLILTWISASAGAPIHSNFYLTICGIMAWGLFPFRDLRRLGTWALLFIAGIWIGQWGHTSLHQFQPVVEQAAGRWFMGLDSEGTDPEISRTSIGSVQDLKQSSQIILRIKPGRGTPPPLLRKAVYNHYKDTVWFAPKSTFHPVSMTGNGDWKIQSTDHSTKSFFISQNWRGNGLLALPDGLSTIKSLDVTQLQENAFRSILATGGPDFLKYEVVYDPRGIPEELPTEEDLKISPNEDIAVTEFVTHHHLDFIPPERAILAVGGIFQNDFRYTTHFTKSENTSKTSPVSNFLNQSHEGHCEYFATATVFILRKLHIPARYVTGYAVPEIEQKTGHYLVRARYAHAWVRAYVGSHWMDVDTTPPGWPTVERDSASKFQPIWDSLNQLLFDFGEWRASHPKATFWIILTLITGILVCIFPRATRKSGLRKKTHSLQIQNLNANPGSDSEFYEIEKNLCRHGFPRKIGETLKQWNQRFHEQPGFGELLEQLICLHNEYRFDPMRMDPLKRKTLTETSRQWIQFHDKKDSKTK